MWPLVIAVPMIFAGIEGIVDCWNEIELEEEQMIQEEKNKREQENQKEKNKIHYIKCISALLATGMVGGAVLHKNKQAE